MLGTRPELLAHLEDEVDRMIELGGDGLSLELLLASARTVDTRGGRALAGSRR